MDRNEFKIEVCANSLDSVLAAKEAGADRVELCAGMPEGGTTPSYGCITAACAIEGIAVNVIIRPRGGDFLYNANERKVMLEDILSARRAGADGIVCGMLTENGDIDRDFLLACMDAAGPLPVTFHRAFDMCRDPYAALETLKSCGVTRLLTSGQQNSALAGADLIARLVEQSGNLIVMPGCGVSASNILQIAQTTRAKEFHLSGRIRQESRMQYRNTTVSMGGTVIIEEYAHEITGIEKVRNLIQVLSQTLLEA